MRFFRPPEPCRGCAARAEFIVEAARHHSQQAAAHAQHVAAIEASAAALRDAHEQEVAFLREQVLGLTRQLLALADPMALARVQHGGIGGPRLEREEGAARPRPARTYDLRTLASRHADRPSNEEVRRLKERIEERMKAEAAATAPPAGMTLEQAFEGQAVRTVEHELDAGRTGT